ncbi:DUF4245 domain-containing protein [Terracoccus sp. 273MFTsu3.1]|uniref:DUF4245 domain-containing protein n=1 Tax=Terracoccus sp. 273MFTsu3.1 TaxID=1172188 RepID=UPI0003A1659E|nr:DUF4245 domain-containing protein [Terracoccus sp. 273MFTsu3.1]
MSTPSTPSTPPAETTPAPVTESPEAAGSTTSAAPPSRYSLGTFPNMFRSMFVIGLFVLALVAIVPRITQVQRPAVDAAGKASQVAAQTSWPVQLPKGLGEGWVPTVATYAPGTEKVQTFTTVWTTPSGKDIALKQAAGATPGWVARSVNDGDAAGTVTVSGRTFEKFVANDAGQVAYVARGDGARGLTLVAGGTAPEDELKAFVAALAPVAPAAGVTPVPSTTTG